MEKFLEKYKIIIAILVLILITGLFATGTYIKSDSLYNKIENVDRTEKLKIGQPHYVDFKEIKTKDSLIKEDSSSIYSQVEVENISKESLYNIGVDLHMQESKEKGHYVGPSYRIGMLRSGETALLSAQHENVSEEAPLEVSECSYNDIEGNALTAAGSYEATGSRTVIVDTDIKIDMLPVTDEVDRLDIGDIKISETSTGKLFEVEVKNVSKEKFEDVYLSFIEYSGGNAIGNLYEHIERLSPEEVKMIRVDLKSDVELKISEYGYRIIDSDTKETHMYDIYRDINMYEIYSYEDSDVVEKRNKNLSLASIALLLCSIIPDKIAKDSKAKGVAEENPYYLKRAKYATVFRWVFLITYCIVLYQRILRK
ncbi:MAG: hypothetical protein WBH44_01100 [Proteocatella sp.]